MSSALRAAAFGGLGLTVAGLTGADAAMADGARLTEALAEAQFSVSGRSFTISRESNPDARLRPDFTRTARACPPFCVQPMQPLPGVATFGELELIAFLQADVAAGHGVLIDARLPEWFSRGSLPSAVNVPFTTLAAANPFRNDILVALGARATGPNEFDFSAALDLVIFCNGAWSDQSLRAMQALMDAGYPVEKLHYYRGGMQDWLMLGISTTTPVTDSGGGG